MSGPQWVNIEDDGAVHVLLTRLAEQLPVVSIDTLWLFSTRRASGVESTVAVISAFDADRQDRRRVGAIRWLVNRDRRGKATVAEEMHEYATAPADALQRVVDGVMRRLGDDTREPPRLIEIGGDQTTWAELIHELGGPPPGTAAPQAEAGTAGENDIGPAAAQADSAPAEDGSIEAHNDGHTADATADHEAGADHEPPQNLAATAE